MNRSVRGGLTNAIAAAAAVGLALSLSACGAPAEPVSTSAVVTTPQAALTGEWILTRTVTASNDLTDPSRILGAVTTRMISFEQETCDTALCPGTVASGVTTEDRESTPFTPTDGGLEWTFDGTLNCLSVATGEVQVADAFTFSSLSVLTVSESAEVDGELSATVLVGTMVLTDSLSIEAFNSGCRRDPAETTVEYTLSAVRAPAAEATEAPATDG